MQSSAKPSFIFSKNRGNYDLELPTPTYTSLSSARHAWCCVRTVQNLAWQRRQANRQNFISTPPPHTNSHFPRSPLSLFRPRPLATTPSTCPCAIMPPPPPLAANPTQYSAAPKTDTISLNLLFGLRLPICGWCPFSFRFTSLQ